MLEEASALFDYLLNHNINSKGRLLRYTCCSNGCRFGFLSDYAYFIESSISLFISTGKSEYKKIAVNYMDFVIDNFYKPENGMFSKSEKGSEVPVVPFKRESNIDLIKPSANSIMAGNMVEMYKITKMRDIFKLPVSKLAILYHHWIFRTITFQLGSQNNAVCATS